MDRRLLVFILANVLLIFLQAQLNHRLAPLSLSLFVPGLLIVLPPLYLRGLSAQVCVLLTGLWLDVALPGIPFGFSTLLFFALSLFIRHYRKRFHPQQNFHPLMLALLVNGIWLLLLWIINGRGHWWDWHYQLRFLMDFAASLLILLAIGGWFFNLQRATIYLLGWKLEPEELPIR
jgi:hypothetical protein